MRIVFKGENFVKMYTGEITYDNLMNFIKSEFPQMGNFTLSFQDDDGDAVMVSSQSDVEVMNEMYGTKEIIRIDVFSSELPSSLV